MERDDEVYAQMSELIRMQTRAMEAQMRALKELQVLVCQLANLYMADHVRHAIGGQP